MCVYLVGTLGLFLVVYGMYIWTINPTDVLSSLLSQSHRLIGWSNPTFILSQPGFQNKLLLDFSYYFFVIAGFWIFTRSKQSHERLLALSTIVFLITLWATSAEQDMLGWYKIPLFIMLGINAARLIKENNIVVFSILTITTVVANIGIVRYPTHPLPEALLLRSVIGILILFFAWLIYHADARKAALLSLAIGLVIYTAQSFYIINSYFGARCRDRVCPTPTVTFSQVVKQNLLQR